MVIRQQPRFPVMFAGTLAYQNRLHLITKSLDLSRKGCRIETPLQAFTGMNVNLVIHLAQGDGPILIERAVVRWCGTREIGIEFQSLTSPHRERLDSSIHILETRVA